jgi:hypothetical protein
MRFLENDSMKKTLLYSFMGALLGSLIPIGVLALFNVFELNLALDYFVTYSDILSFLVCRGACMGEDYWMHIFTLLPSFALYGIVIGLLIRKRDSI